MGDAENALPSSKKRAAGREISRDNPGLDDDEDDAEQESGTFKKASEEVLATRRIVKVRRHQTPASASSNPFANISLVPPPTVPTANLTEVTTGQQAVDETLASEEKEGSADDNGSIKAPASIETNDALKETPGEVGAGSADKGESDLVGKSSAVETAEKEPAKGPREGEEAEKDNGHGDASPSVTTIPLSSFQQLSSYQNAFTGLSGTGFSSSTFSFGSVSKDGPAFGAGSGSVFGVKNDGVTFPSFNFGKSSNGSSSLFGAAGASDASKSENTGLPSMHEVAVETGEENEKAVFTADAVLFEYLDGGWKERGKGELKVNVCTSDAERARLLMRARGNYRLILNASLFPDMKLTSMDKRGITFACINSTGEDKNGLTTFALKFKDGSVVEDFRTAVALHKGKAAVLKTPENSPKASDD